MHTETLELKLLNMNFTALEGLEFLGLVSNEAFLVLLNVLDLKVVKIITMTTRISTAIAALFPL